MLKTDRESAAGEDAIDVGQGAAFSSAVFAVIAAVTMLFAAFSSAYIVRRGLSSDWSPVELPRVVWASPVALILAYAMLKWRRRRGAMVFGLIAGLIIGESCREVAKAAVSKDSSGTAFFYIFSGAFLLCWMVGVVALVRNRTRIASLYWLYLTGLWSWLLSLQAVWR